MKILLILILSFNFVLLGLSLYLTHKILTLEEDSYRFSEAVVKYMEADVDNALKQTELNKYFLKYLNVLNKKHA